MSNKARRMLVLLLIILKEAGPTAACSSSCSSECDCSSRGLTSVPQDLPTGITRLTLDGNAITNLSQSDFSRYTSLTRLDLNSNQIAMIHNETFHILTSLDRLYLRGNQLTSLPADIFVKLGNLRYLYLNGNQLTSLSADIFAGLGRLQWLSLYLNPLTSLPADIFDGLGNLWYLSLAANRLTSLPADIFAGFRGLGHLVLHQNKLETISFITYDMLASIPNVYLENNPWQCDCRMLPFRERMTGSYPFEDQIRCAGPGNLARQYLRDVNPENLICEETTPVYSTLSTKRIVDSTLSLSTVSSSSPFHQSAKSTSKAPTLSPTPSNTPTADSNPGWSTVSSSPLFDPSVKSTSELPAFSQTPQTARNADSNPGWSTVSTDSPFGFQSTMSESNAGPTGGGIVLSVPVLATLCIFLGLFIISTFALAVCFMYKRRERDPNSEQNSSNSNPAGTSSGHDQIRQPAGINSPSKMSDPGTEDNQHVYNVPTDNPDAAEYDKINEINQSERPKQDAGNMQHLGSFEDGYEIPSPSLGHDSGADP